MCRFTANCEYHYVGLHAVFVFAAGARAGALHRAAGAQTGAGAQTAGAADARRLATARVAAAAHAQTTDLIQTLPAQPEVCRPRTPQRSGECE